MHFPSRIGRLDREAKQLLGSLQILWLLQQRRGAGVQQSGRLLLPLRIPMLDGKLEERDRLLGTRSNPEALLPAALGEVESLAAPAGAESGRTAAVEGEAESFGAGLPAESVR